MSDTPVGPGWWQASDGKFYAPEQHPGNTPPPPSQASSPTPPNEPAKASRPWFRKKRFLVPVGLLAVVIVIGVLAPSGDEEDNTYTATSASESDTGATSETEAQPEPEPEPEVMLELELGTRQMPFAFDTPSEIVLETYGDADGSVWAVTVGELTDATARVLDSNQFNDAPPEGVLFAAFALDIELLDASKVPLSAGFNLGWEIFGAASSTVYDFSTVDDLFGCGVFDDEFNQSHEAYIGGTLSGEVCIPLPVADFEDPATQIALVPSAGDRIFFAPNGTPADEPRSAAVATDIGTGTGDGTRQAPLTFDSSSPEFKVDAFGDVDGSVWSVSIGAPQDITAAVLAENSFNDEPRDGYLFAGFDVALTLIEAPVDPVSPGFVFTWEILGGTSRRVHSNSWDASCGVVPNEVDMYIDVLSGGVISGTACVAIPIEDFGADNTQVALNIGGERMVFG